MAQGRFERFTPNHQIRLVLEGELNRMGQGGEQELEDLLFLYQPDLVIVDILAKIKRQNNGHYDAEYQAMSELKELVDQYDVDCLVLTHSGKPNSNDSDDPFDKIIGSTALQGVPDNLLILTQFNGQTKLHAKGRLIFPSEKILNFEGGKYEERIGASAEYEDKAPIQAKVLEALKKAPMTVSELVLELDRDKGQISRACTTLSKANKIRRTNINEAWHLRDWNS